MKTPEEIEKLALDKFPTTINKYTEVNEKAIMRFGFIKGYNQCQQDNTDKKYTLQDIKDAFYAGDCYGRADYVGNSQPFLDIEEYVESLNKKD